ncbi:MAG: protein-glutamate O-methyltransferase CheR [Candidatus Nealsonbacteria bacterium]|nr:protein-glutamate O-methyltransferase CheR [Candidatus Nealsonbacteria bacterium]
MPAKDVEQVETEILLEGIFRRWGYDFRHYARASLKRRLQHRLALSGLNHLSEMLPKILHEEEFFNLLLKDLSVTVTEMFRDPHFYVALREQVVPVLRTYPFIKVWHAGCATGEEVYSTAILLNEEGLYDRTQFYATDYNNQSLEIARQGMYPLDNIRAYTANYHAAGGKASFSDYYHAKYGSAKLNEALKENVTFAHHNLVTDGAFGEMNLIVCRNVMIYFDGTLQDRALSLFCDSLCHRGYLCLGTKETIDFSAVSDRFEAVAGKERIFRMVAHAASHVAGGCTP